MQMQVKWTKTDDWHIARFRSKNLDECAEESPLVLNYIESLPPGPRVALSFRGVEWISSRVISLILTAKAATQKKGGKFAIATPNEKVLEALKITKLDRTLTIVDSTNDLA
jgi:anti-anti-sigma factor